MAPTVLPSASSCSTSLFSGFKLCGSSTFLPNNSRSRYAVVRSIFPFPFLSFSILFLIFVSTFTHSHLVARNSWKSIVFGLFFFVYFICAEFLISYPQPMKHVKKKKKREFLYLCGLNGALLIISHLLFLFLFSLNCLKYEVKASLMARNE